MTMSVEPLSGALGAEIKGVDLRRPLDDATVKAVNAAFDEHVVVVFRDQELSEADQLRAAGYFGKVHIRRRPVNGRTPGGDYDTPFMMVTNIVENGKSVGAFGDGEMWFHHDTSYYPQPHRATFLYSMQLTSSGGETCFSNMYKAYDNIPRALRDRLEGRNVLQVHDYKRRERLDLSRVELEKILHHEQPIIITHPFDIAEDPAIVYEHEWRLGDLVVWDNWCSIHARKDFPREEPRLMRRCTIEGQALRY
jgi:taurine dioxygenase